MITLPTAYYIGHCHPEVFSVPYGNCHSEVFSVPYGHCHYAVISAPHGHCHSEVFSVPYGHCHSAPYGHSHSAPYRHSAAVMHVPSPRTASRQIDAAASHSCHFNTVLYPRSYSQCQPPLNCSHHDIPGAAFSVQNYRSQCIMFTGTSADLSKYI